MSNANGLIRKAAHFLLGGIAVVMAGASTATAIVQGDCDDNGNAAIFEVQRCVNIFLSPSRLLECAPCDQDGNASVDIAEVQGAANCFLRPSHPGCQSVVAPPTATPTNVPPPTPTATSGTAVCGNGSVEPPETCDDNNINSGDACPPDCILRGCTPDGTTRAVDVTFQASVGLISITVFVEYPDGALQIPGTGTNTSVGQRVINRPGGFLATVVDFDYGLRAGLSGSSPLTNPRLFTVNFDHCLTAPAATVGDFNCTVIEAVNQMFQNVPGVTCSVSLP